ncbi:hypothetical protein pipiens_019839, partial [Culex pipiens pipiens]
MFQKAGESDLAFVNRVGSIARLCEYDKDKEFEEIVGAVAEHARDKEVRSAALKLLSRKGSVSELIDKVREIEAIRLNEEYVMLKRGNVESAQVAAVESGRWAGNQQQRYYNPDGYGYQQERWQRSGHPYSRGNPYQRGHSYQRGHPYQRGQSYQKGNSSQRGQSSGRRGGQSPRYAAPPKAPDCKVEAQEARKDCCWRCGGQFHSPDDCTSIDKICDKCGRRGHIQRACVVGGKRSAAEGLGNDSREVAAVEKEDERVESSIDANCMADPRDTQVVGTAKVVTHDDQSVVKEQFATSTLQAERTVEQMSAGFIEAQIAGLRCVFLIDSGAQVNTVTAEIFAKLIGDA